MSDYVIEANGFVPVPYIITEPALGGFGGALIPVFIKKRPPYIDSVRGTVIKTPVPPDVTGGLAAYTLNNSWVLATFRSGTLIKSRIKYIAGGGYADINMSFFLDINHAGEKEFKFNIRTFPVMLQATRRLGFSHWYAGLKYLFLSNSLHYIGENVTLSAVGDSLSISSVISQPGIIVEFDNRDNIFTPDKGFKVHIEAGRSDAFFGSDYDFWRINYYTYLYGRAWKKFVGGLRVDGQQTSGDLPFYMKPYISMRGVPIMRYQGNASLLTEGEVRWDIVPRWSTVLFGGTGKAFDEWKDVGSSDWVYSYGTGFRYLLARKFKLRVGIDVAASPGTWAYYIVFGSNWLK